MALHSKEARKVRRELDKQLAASAAASGHDLVWTAQELETLAFIQSEIDRKCDLERDYAAAETAKERVSIGRELRLTKASIARLLSKVSTEDQPAKPMTQASARASRAANARWHPPTGATGA